MNFKKWTDKAKDVAKDAVDKIEEGSGKVKKTLTDVAKKSPKEHLNEIKERYEEGKKIAAELKEQMKNMTKEEAVEFMKYTYSGMTSQEALKMVTAVVIPGGIPVYLALKLQQYKTDKKTDAVKNSAPTPKPANENKPGPKTP